MFLARAMVKVFGILTNQENQNESFLFLQIISVSF